MGTATRAGIGLKSLERANTQLRIGWADLAATIGVDQSTLYRWRNGESIPRPIARSRIVQFEELLDLLSRLFAGPELARQWLHEGKPASLAGSTPLETMRSGRMDRVLMLLYSLATGG